MSLSRRVWMLLLAAMLAVGAGSLVIHALAMRDTLSAQLRLRNEDAAAALAVALSQQGGDASLMALVARAQFDTGHYRRIVLEAGGATQRLERQADGSPHRWLARALPVTAEPGRAIVSHGWTQLGQVEVEGHAAWAYETLAAALWRSAALVAAVTLASAALATWLLRRWRRPLDAAVAQARALEQGRFERAVVPDVPELALLTRTMNRMVGRLEDVFAGQAAQAEALRREAHSDPLTGLANRRHFVGQLETAGGGALLLLRLRPLEELNRRLGHAGTDALLASVAEVLQNYPQHVKGAFAGRLNGSDFALALPVPGLAAETAASLSAALRAALGAVDAGADLIVGGIDPLPAPAGTAAAREALARADAALARAEASGPFGVEVDLGTPALPPLGERGWRERLTGALQPAHARLGAFPVLARDGRLLHLECPLWLDVSGTEGEAWASARQWLPLAARARLLPMADLLALDLALAAIAADGRPRCIHVSGASLASGEFADHLRRRLGEARLDPSAGLLSIELQESAAVEAGRLRLGDALGQWRRLGARLGLEHAGGALPSLAGLAGLGLDYVKIDARFVRGVADDADVRAFARSLVGLVHGMGWQVIAEGIDAEGDLALLWTLGFDGATGPALREPN